MTAPAPSRGAKPSTTGEPGGASAPGSVELELLYRNEQHALVRFFTRYRASRDDAQDLVQETLGQSSTLVLLNGDRPPLGGATGTFADLSMNLDAITPPRHGSR